MYNSAHIYHPEGLGLVATSRRSIRDGREYARFFDAAKSETKIVKGDADVQDTVAHALAMIKREAPSVLKLAKYLERSTLQETARSFFNYMYNHYQYKIDTPGQEQLRTPARAFKDRTTGIDCDCYSISIGAMLTALKIPFALRIIKMYNKQYYQHIYVVVPKFTGADLNTHSNYWVIDPVLDTFDKEAPYTAKQDYIMQLAELSGITAQGTDIGREFDGFGETCEGTLHTYNKRMHNHIVNTRNAIVKSPHKVKGFYDPHKFVQVADSVIKNWNNDQSRAKALAWASDVEAGIVHEDMQGMQGIMHGDDYGNELHDYLGNDLDYLEAMSGFDLTAGLGKVKSIKTKMAAAKAKISVQAAKANKTKKGFFTKIKNAEKTVAKTVGKKLDKGLVKKVFKLTQKVNPAAVAIRGAVLASMKLNVGHYSAKLKLAYGPQAEAEKAGYNYAQLVQAKNKIEKMFADVLGGDPAKLREAIITHKQILHKAIKGMDEMEGLGIVVATVAAASTAAASPFLAKIAAILKGILQNPKLKAKLTQGAKTAVNTFIENKSADAANDNESSNLSPQENTNYIPSSPLEQNSGGNQTTTVDQPSSATDENGDPVATASKFPKALVYGGIAAAAVVALGLAFTGSKSTSKSVGSIAKKSTQVNI